MKAGLALLALALAAGCHAPAIRRAPAPSPLSDAPPLDVRIAVFAAPERAGAAWETPRRLFAAELAEAMRGQPDWSRVRVGPASGPASAAEVEVEGRLIGNGLARTRVRLVARDARGVRWFDRVYEAAERTGIWSRAAADLSLAARALTPEDRAGLPGLARLHFAALLSPGRFGGHLARDADGRWTVRRLPAADDPHWLRALRVHGRESLLADAVDERHRLHAAAAGPLHRQFREFAAEDERRRREIAKSSWTHPFRTLAGGFLSGFSVLTGAAAGSGDGALARTAERMERAGDTLASGPDRELHQLRLNLTAATRLLAAESEPFNLELDGAVHRLTGSAEQQYAQLRDILRRLHEEETRP